MPDPLYLDTARLGRISPSALRAHRDAAALAAAEGASAHFDRFLAHGLAACPRDVRDRYPGLAAWAGVADLKRALGALVGHGPELPVLIANRSAQLMKLATRLLFGPCRSVLTTDLGWPPYAAVLEDAARRAGRAVTTVAVREDALAGRIGETELVDAVGRAYARGRCDGLFLTAVGHLGVRLPVERIVRAAEAAGEVRFVAVDGAQEFCHTRAPVRAGCCDLYIAGCHKWLAAHHPMGLGFYGRPRSRTVIDTTLESAIADGTIDDPLLALATKLETNDLGGAGETVNLVSLFTARAAAGDQIVPEAGTDEGRNSVAVAAAAERSGWRPLLPDQNLRSRILLLKAERAAVRAVDPQRLRNRLRDAGVAATTYPGGLVRLALPDRELEPPAVTQLTEALRLAA